MWKNIYKQRAQLGMHLEKSRLRATFLTLKKNTPVMQHFSYDLIDANHKQIVVQLHKLTQALGGQCADVVVSLAYQHTIWKTMEFNANISDEEIYEFLTRQSAIFFGGKTEDFYCDYQNIAIENTPVSKRRIRIIAANKNDIQKLFALFRPTKFMLRAVEPDVFALNRGARTSFKINLGAILGIFHIVAQNTIFCVSHNNLIIYVETIVADAGFNFFQACQKSLKYYQSMHPRHTIDQVLFIGNSVLLDDKSRLQSLLTCPISFAQNDFLISDGLALWSEDSDVD